MRPHDKVVKDKRIMLDGEGYLAVVEYFRDTPERDDDTPQEHNFATMDAAQKWLEKFPRDAWLGFEITEIIQRELDRKKNNVRHTEREDNVLGEAARYEHDDLRVFGRSFAR